MLPTSLSPSNSLSVAGGHTPCQPTSLHLSVIFPILRRPPLSQGSGNTLTVQFLSRPPHVGPPIPSRRSQPLPWHLQLLCHQKPSPQCPLSFSPLRLACPHQWPRPLLGPTAVGPRSLTGDAVHGHRSRCPILPG